MKKWLLIVVACILLTGCEDVLVLEKLPPIQDDRLVGTWASSDDPDDVGIIEKSGEGYIMRSSAPNGERVKLTLARAGNVEFAQLEEKCGQHVFSFAGDTRTCYRIVRIELEADSLRFWQLDVDQFQDADDLDVQYRVASAQPRRGDKTTCALIDAPLSELVAFLAAYPVDRYKEGDRLTRKN
jgi:hypothetical protein